jgi:hypothetical protein
MQGSRDQGLEESSEKENSFPLNPRILEPYYIKEGRGEKEMRLFRFARNAPMTQ